MLVKRLLGGTGEDGDGGSGVPASTGPSSPDCGPFFEEARRLRALLDEPETLTLKIAERHTCPTAGA
jgi:hypothetical protein